MIDEKKIEKAASDYCGTGIYGFKAIPMLESMFYQGAHWAINSLWHPNGEEPEDGAECLIDTGKGIRLCYWNSYDKCWDDEEEDDYFCEMSYIKRWCYISDLLPQEGGKK